MVRTAWSLLLLLVLLASPSQAALTFTQLDQDTFTVSHKIKGFGSRGKATRLVNEKAASLCLAAGFTHMEILDNDSQGAGWGPANSVAKRVGSHTAGRRGTTRRPRDKLTSHPTG